MRKDLEEIISWKKANRVRQPKNDVEAVVRFLVSQDVKLTKSQDDLCTRLMYVDSLIRARKHPDDEIVDLIKEKFGVSQYRARQDLYDCHKVFGMTRKVNKVYLLSHHLSDIALAIQKARDANKQELLPKLYDNYTYALNSLPADDGIKDATPANITYIFNGAAPVKQDPIDKVLEESDKLLNGEYIDFEDSGAESAADDVPDDPGE